MLGSLTALSGLLRADARRIARDRFLIAAALYLLGSAALMRWGLPWIARVVQSSFGLRIEPYYPLMTSYFAVVMGSLAVGVIGGFLLLELKENRSILALMVTPPGIGAYLTAVSAVMSVAGAGLIAAEAAIIGHGLPSPAFSFIGVSLVGGLAAPVIGLTLATLADDKVEAFALMKLVGLSGVMPVAAYFVPSPWQYVAGIIPVFWPMKAWWLAEAGEGAWTVSLLCGAVVCLALLSLLLWLFSSRTTRRM